MSYTMSRHQLLNPSTLKVMILDMRRPALPSTMQITSTWIKMQGALTQTDAPSKHNINSSPQDSNIRLRGRTITVRRREISYMHRTVNRMIHLGIDKAPRGSPVPLLPTAFDVCKCQIEQRFPLARLSSTIRTMQISERGLYSVNPRRHILSVTMPPKHRAIKGPTIIYRTRTTIVGLRSWTILCRSILSLTLWLIRIPTTIQPRFPSHPVATAPPPESRPCSVVTSASRAPMVVTANMTPPPHPLVVVAVPADDWHRSTKPSRVRTVGNVSTKLSLSRHIGETPMARGTVRRR